MLKCAGRCFNSRYSGKPLFTKLGSTALSLSEDGFANKALTLTRLVVTAVRKEYTHIKRVIRMMKHDDMMIVMVSELRDIYRPMIDATFNDIYICEQH